MVAGSDRGWIVCSAKYRRIFSTRRRKGRRDRLCHLLPFLYSGDNLVCRQTYRIADFLSEERCDMITRNPKNGSIRLRKVLIRSNGLPKRYKSSLRGFALKANRTNLDIHPRARYAVSRCSSRD